jgi:hypothetical protein
VHAADNDAEFGMFSRKLVNAELRLVALDQYERRNNVEIRGTEYVEGMQADRVVALIFQAVQ